MATKADDTRALRDKVEALQKELRDLTKEKEQVEARAAKLDRELNRAKSAKTKKVYAVPRWVTEDKLDRVEGEAQEYRRMVSELKVELARLRSAESPRARPGGTIHRRLVPVQMSEDPAVDCAEVASLADCLSPEQLLTIAAERNAFALYHLGSFAPAPLGTWRLQHTLVNEDAAVEAVRELPGERLVAVTEVVASFETRLQVVWWWSKFS